LNPRQNYVYTVAIYLNLQTYNTVVQNLERIRAGGPDGKVKEVEILQTP